MRITKYGVLFVMVLAGGLQSAYAQLEVSDSGSSCGQIEALRKAGNFGEARAKAQACLDALTQEANEAAAKLFPTDVAGWKRTNIEQSQALGFTNISATYKKGNHTTTVALTGGKSGDALGGVLGGIAKFGIKSSGKPVKVAGLPGSAQADGNVMVTLDDGSFLGFSCPDFPTADEALAGFGDLINAFPVADINKRLK